MLYDGTTVGLAVGADEGKEVGINVGDPNEYVGVRVGGVVGVDDGEFDGTGVGEETV